MRMIDANKFRRFAHEQLENDKLYSADDILEMIDEQPTAYEVDAVVKELEDMKTKTFVSGITFDPYEFGACHAIDKAIEIVKGGVK